MLTAGFHFYGISGFYILNNVVNYDTSFTGNHIPYFISEFMAPMAAKQGAQSRLKIIKE